MRTLYLWPSAKHRWLGASENHTLRITTKQNITLCYQLFMGTLLQFQIIPFVAFSHANIVGKK